MSSPHANWFVGLPIRAEGWFERLPEPPRGVRRFSAGDLHATVAFLGAVGDEAARRGFAAARAWPTGPLPVRLGPVRPFGSKRHPSALSAVFGEGNDAVVDAISEVRDEVLAAADARPDPRPPLPHVTLARIGRRAGPEDRRHALAWARTVDLGAVSTVLDRVALYTWSDDRRRSLFRIVDSFEILSDSPAPQPGGRPAGEDG